jgi:hypothetical protein
MDYDWGTLSDDQPRKLAFEPELAAYLLTPGFSRSYQQHALGVSNATMWKYATWAREAADRNSLIGDMVNANIGSITREHAIQMAQRRGHCQLPFWSKLAICELLEEGTDPGRVALIFGCSARSVYYARTRPSVAFNFLNGTRQISSSQMAPPARGWGFTQSGGRSAPFRAVPSSASTLP